MLEIFRIFLLQKMCFFIIAYYSINFLIILLLLKLGISEIAMTAVHIAKVGTI